MARFANYFRLGVDHILSGLDHLLFIFALLLTEAEEPRLVLASLRPPAGVLLGR